MFGYASFTCGSAAKLAIAASSSAGSGGSGAGGAAGSADSTRVGPPRRPNGTGPRPRPLRPKPGNGARVEVTVMASKSPALVNRLTNCRSSPTPSDTIPESDAIPIDTPSIVSAVRSLA